MRFDGDFALLPFRAGIRYGAVPAYPTSAEFHAAVSNADADLEEYPEAHWHIEAVRERRLNPGRSLDEARPDINARVARRLYELREAA